MSQPCFLITESLPGAQPIILHYTKGPLPAKKSLEFVARQKCIEVSPSSTQKRVFRYREVSAVPTSGTFVFQGDENPTVSKLEVRTRTPGRIWGYSEDIIATYDIIKVNAWTMPTSAPAVSASAPARITVSPTDSDERKKEGAAREELHKEVCQAVKIMDPLDDGIKHKDKVIDGIDRFHNELVDNVIQMRKRRQLRKQ